MKVGARPGEGEFAYALPFDEAGMLRWANLESSHRKEMMAASRLRLLSIGWDAQDAAAEQISVSVFAMSGELGEDLLDDLRVWEEVERARGAGECSFAVGTMESTWEATFALALRAIGSVEESVLRARLRRAARRPISHCDWVDVEG